MAKNDRKLLQYGIGLVYNVTSGLCLGEFAADWKIIPELKVDDIPFAHVFDDGAVPIGRRFRVQATLQELTPQWLADFTGCALANGGKFYLKENVTSSAGTITLTKGAGGTEGFVGIASCKHIASDTYRVEDSSAVANVSFTRSGKTLTLHGSDIGLNGEVFEVAYFYTDSATTDGKMVIDPTLIPGQVALLLPWAYVNPKTGAISHYVVWDCTKCVFTKLPEIGGAVQGRHSMQFEARVIVQSAGDLVVYWNGYNPTY